MLESANQIRFMDLELIHEKKVKGMKESTLLTKCMLNYYINYFPKKIKICSNANLIKIKF